MYGLFCRVLRGGAGRGGGALPRTLHRELEAPVLHLLSPSTTSTSLGTHRRRSSCVCDMGGTRPATRAPHEESVSLRRPGGLLHPFRPRWTRWPLVCEGAATCELLGIPRDTPQVDGPQSSSSSSSSEERPSCLLSGPDQSRNRAPQVPLGVTTRSPIGKMRVEVPPISLQQPSLRRKVQQSTLPSGAIEEAGRPSSTSSTSHVSQSDLNAIMNRKAVAIKTEALGDEAEF